MRPLFALLAVLASASITSAAHADEVAAVAARAPIDYGPEEVAVIMYLRAQGESLAAVARTVGGTRDDVRAAERAELARRKAGAPAHALTAAERERLPCLALVCPVGEAHGVVAASR
jgi:hypothetical protein